MTREPFGDPWGGPDRHGLEPTIEIVHSKHTIEEVAAISAQATTGRQIDKETGEPLGAGNPPAMESPLGLIAEAARRLAFDRRFIDKRHEHVTFQVLYTPSGPRVEYMLGERDAGPEVPRYAVGAYDLYPFPDSPGFGGKVIFAPGCKSLQELDASAVAEADVVVIDGDLIAKDRHGTAPRRAAPDELADLRRMPEVPLSEIIDSMQT